MLQFQSDRLKAEDKHDQFCLPPKNGHLVIETSLDVFIYSMFWCVGMNISVLWKIVLTYFFTIVEDVHLVFETGRFRVKVRDPLSLFGHVFGMVSLLTMHSRIAQHCDLRFEMGYGSAVTSQSAAIILLLESLEHNKNIC